MIGVLIAAILVLGRLAFLYFFKNPLMPPLKHLRSEHAPKPTKIVKPDERPSEDEVNAVLEKVARSGIQSRSQ